MPHLPWQIGHIANYVRGFRHAPFAREQGRQLGVVPRPRGHLIPSRPPRRLLLRRRSVHAPRRSVHAPRRSTLRRFDARCTHLDARHARTSGARCLVPIARCLTLALWCSTSVIDTSVFDAHNSVPDASAFDARTSVFLASPLIFSACK
ncbi:UNVERIFIED_CONTAM: hypothetical protein FKN15_052454 [Acipenser sinensis]